MSSPTAPPLSSPDKRDSLKSLIKPFLRRSHASPIDAFKSTFRLSSRRQPFRHPSCDSALRPHASISDLAQHPSLVGGPSCASPPRKTSSLNLDLDLSPPNHSKTPLPSSANPLGRLVNAALRHSLLLELPASSPPTCTTIRSSDHLHHSSSDAGFSSDTLPTPATTTNHLPSSDCILEPLISNKAIAASPSMASSLTPLSLSRPSLPCSLLASSVHSLLIRPALVTLAHLAPPHLLSGVHSGCFESPDLFPVLESFRAMHSGVRPSGHSGSLPSVHSEALVPKDSLGKLSAPCPPQHLTTIEQLSASCIALPVTSVSSIWRLLSCLEWVNLAAHDDMLHQPLASNSYSSNPPSYLPLGSVTAHQHPLSQPYQIGSFDLANTLQHVGDILSAMSCDAGVEMVFYHIFYPIRSEQSALALLHHPQTDSPTSSPAHPTLSFPASATLQQLPGQHATTPPSSSPASLPRTTPNPFLGVGADGEGGLREISVRADERGLIVGLTCLLRQVLIQAKPSSTIEVGLHLTPLYGSKSGSLKKSMAETCPSDLPGPAAHSPQPESAVEENEKTLVSWKCVFDVSLTPPVLPKSVGLAASAPAKASLQALSSLVTDGPRIHDTCTNSKASSGEGALRGPSTGQSFDALARLRMTSSTISELPLCPEDLLSKTIFEKLLRMKLSTGRLTSGGHSWKVTGVFERGLGRELDHPTHPQAQFDTLPPPATLSGGSQEPTADQLTLFAERVLKGKKAVLFAAEQSIFAKHITTYLTSWNMDVSHMPYEVGPKGLDDPLLNPLGTGIRNYPLVPKDTIKVDMIEPNNPSGPNPVRSSHPAPVGEKGQGVKSGQSSGFLIIDDDIATLKAQLTKLWRTPPTPINLPLNLLSSRHQAQRPPLTRKTKSSAQVERLEAPTSRISMSIIHFTSISNIRQVQEHIRNQLDGVQWPLIPNVLIIPKPIGPRRLLTALHTAVNKPLTEPELVPIATSPSSPSQSPQNVAANHHLSHRASPLGKTSPVVTQAGMMDFDTAAAHHLQANPLHNAALPLDTNPKVTSSSVQGSTPPGLRTPGTTPGTPVIPSPALLSTEALEYFSRAASENGGSSSTGVVLQSPDGRPQAMFFHHSVSSRRGCHSLSMNPGSHSHFHSSQPRSAVAGALSRTSSGRAKREHGASTSNPMIRENVSSESGSEPRSLLAQRTISKVTDVASPGQGWMTKSPTDYLSPATPAEPRRTSASLEPVSPHAMSLGQFEAISPKTPSVALTLQELCAGSSAHGQDLTAAVLPVVSVSSGLTAGVPTSPVASHDLGCGPVTALDREPCCPIVNPRPVPMLRMPTIPAALPNNITATLSAPRRPQVLSNPLPASLAPSTFKSRPDRPNSPPLPVAPGPTVSEEQRENELGKSATCSSGVATGAQPTRKTSGGVSIVRRATMGGDGGMIGRLGRKKTCRKPATTLVPPINVLIVEDNRINQTILATFMRKKSVKYDVAMNGQEAVDKWRSGSFHLVLMDLQLPVKDGIEATKEIREAERAVNINAFANTPPAAGGNTPPALGGLQNNRPWPHNVSVIIVALTASSLDVDREVALAAGCNDFLTKPVSLAWLEKKLLEWGSMAWLSGFSRPSHVSQQSQNWSMPVSSGVVKPSRPMGMDEGTALSAVRKLAERKAKDVAEHLHLKPGLTDHCASQRATSTTVAHTSGATTSATGEFKRSVGGGEVGESGVGHGPSSRSSSDEAATDGPQSMSSEQRDVVNDQSE